MIVVLCLLLIILLFLLLLLLLPRLILLLLSAVVLLIVYIIVIVVVIVPSSLICLSRSLSKGPSTPLSSATTSLAIAWLVTTLLLVVISLDLGVVLTLILLASLCDSFGALVNLLKDMKNIGRLRFLKGLQHFLQLVEAYVDDLHCLLLQVYMHCCFFHDVQRLNHDGDLERCCPSQRVLLKACPCSSYPQGSEVRDRDPCPYSLHL